MITPEEIKQIEFKKGFRGYSEEEVDLFLERLKDDYEAIIKENEALKEQVLMYKEQNNKYTSIEETLKETLITAQSAAEDTTNAANKKARVIVQEAELQSKQMIDKASNKVLEIRNEYESLLKEFKIFRNKFKSLLEDEIKNVDDIFSDTVREDASFSQMRPSNNFDATGTMKIEALENEQDIEEEKTMSIPVVKETVEEKTTEKANSPEDIFNIK